jgi:hypothetical protein
MSLNLSDEEIHGLIAYARDKFVTEQYPFAPALRPIRDVLAKLDPKPIPEPPAPKKPYAPSLVLQRKTSGGAESSTKLDRISRDMHKPQFHRSAQRHDDDGPTKLRRG